jgi:hypothetical protein
MINKIKAHSRCAKWWLIVASVSATVGTILLFASIINHLIKTII